MPLGSPKSESFFGKFPKQYEIFRRYGYFSPHRCFNSIQVLTDLIMNIKKGDRHADTSKLEKAIDALVYQLYRLTEEEIKIVEGEK